MILRSLQRGLAFHGSRSLGVLTISGGHVVVLLVGFVSFFYDPVAFCIVVRVLLSWGPVCGGPIFWVLLGSFDAADTHLVLECLDGLLGGTAVGDHPF